MRDCLLDGREVVKGDVDGHVKLPIWLCAETGTSAAKKFQLRVDLDGLSYSVSLLARFVAARAQWAVSS